MGLRLKDILRAFKAQGWDAIEKRIDRAYRETVEADWDRLSITEQTVLAERAGAFRDRVKRELRKAIGA